MYNHEPNGYACTFCGYAAEQYNEHVRHSHVVERTVDTLTFVSPKWWLSNEGHVIVVPVRHVENLYDLEDELALPLMAATRRAALALKAAYGCAGTSTRQHNEPAGNQEVWHLHVHVFPRHDGDDLYGSASRRARADEMDAYADRLRAAYASPQSR